MTNSKNKDIVSKWNYQMLWNYKRISILSNDVNNSMDKLVIFNKVVNNLDNIWAKRYEFLSKRRIFK